MKKNKIVYLFIGGIIGTLLFSSISALAISKLYADSVSINTKNIDTLQEGATLQDALDDLYDLTSGKYFTNEDAQKLINQVNELKNNQMSADSVLNKIYPVGSIYVSTTLKTAAEVKSAIGGTWESYGDGKVLRGTTGTSGETGGNSNVSLTTANLPKHNHSYTPSGTVSRPTFTGSAVTSGSTGSGYSIGYTYATRTTSSAGSHTHVLNATGKDFVVPSGFGSGQTFPNNGSGTTTGGHWFTGSFIAAAAGAHTHTYPDYYANSISGVQAHTHSVTAAGTVSQPTFTGTASSTGSTGSGTAFSVLDPYITVYMYKRTA